MTEPEPTESPLHGYRGEMTSPPTGVRPRGVSVAISREAGARGETIAAAVGRLLGWQVFTAEMLDFLTQDERAREEMSADLPDSARRWIEVEVAALGRARKLDVTSALGLAARLALTLAARGDAVIVGRGAGFVLPAATTVHVRLVAPLPQRVAYFAQWQRLTDAEAEREVRARDHKRAEFLAAIAGRDPADPTAYDLVLNSARLGADGCAELIARAARVKLGTAGLPPSAPDPA